MGAAQKIAGYFLFINGEKFGPVSKDEVAGYFAEGRVLPTDLVWTEGYEDWVEIQSTPEFSQLFNSKPTRQPTAKLPKMPGTTTPHSRESKPYTWKDYVKLVVLAFVMLILSVCVWALLAPSPTVKPSGSAAKNDTGAPPLDADLGPLGKLSALLPRVAGKNGTVRWEARGNDFFAIISKPGGNSSIRFTAQPYDRSKKDVQVSGDITEITVNGNPCHFSSLGDVAICIGLMAKAP